MKHRYTTIDVMWSKNDKIGSEGLREMRAEEEKLKTS